MSIREGLWVFFFFVFFTLDFIWLVSKEKYRRQTKNKLKEVRRKMYISKEAQQMQSIWLHALLFMNNLFSYESWFNKLITSVRKKKKRKTFVIDPKPYIRFTK